MDISPPPAITVPGRICGDCALCCKLGEIPGLKPYNAWCRFCSTQAGCDAYDARPQPCRDFYCHYLTSDLSEDWRPRTCGMVVSAYANPPRLTVSVDPDMPPRWRDSPYLEQIQHWAHHGAVTVMEGLMAYAAYPDRIEPLGEITDDYQLVIIEEDTTRGRRYRTERVARGAP